MLGFCCKPKAGYIAVIRSEPKDVFAFEKLKKVKKACSDYSIITSRLKKSNFY